MELVLSGKGPLYLQVAKALRDAIKSGRLPSGSRIPSSRELAARLDTSRTTIVAAYDLLRSEGLLSGKIGAGTRVLPVRVSRATKPVSRLHVEAQSAYAGRSRSIFRLSDTPGHRFPGVRYAFRYGLPNVSATLSTQWARELSRAAAYTQPNFPAPQGLAVLRAAISDHVSRRRGIPCTPEDILVVNGAQQAFSLIARVLLDPGDEAALEEPGYFGARRILEMHGARVHPIPVDGQGLRCAELVKHRVKLTCVTPSHQLPTGSVMSFERRKALLEYAHRNKGWICEDDYDGEFRYLGTSVPALKSLDSEGCVIYVGTFSKTLFPSLRLGYVLMPPALRDDLIAAKWANDFGTNGAIQHALANFIASGAYDRHLNRALTKLAERRRLLISLLRQHCGNRLEFSETTSGMHLLVWIHDLPAHQGDLLISSAAQRGLGLYSVKPFYVTPPRSTGLLMGFSSMSPAEMSAAVKLFAECLSLFPAGSGRQAARRSGKR